LSHEALGESLHQRVHVLQSLDIWIPEKIHKYLSTYSRITQIHPIQVLHDLTMEQAK